jgi:TonB-linked SusC/RagA family outer membrane protein
MKIKPSNQGMSRFGIPLKILLIMKLIVIFLTVFLVQVRASVLAQSVSLNEKNVSLQYLIDKIRLQTEYDFLVLDYKLINNVGNISIQLKNVSLAEALNKLLTPRNLCFSIKDKSIVIKERASEIAQQLIIKGKVSNEEGLGLAGVSVSLKNTRTVTTTNGKGEFSIAIPKIGDVLVFTFVGMLRQEVATKSPNELLKVRMVPEISTINEVVVTGVRNVRQESFTGSATTLKGEDLRRVGNINIFQSLKNLDPTINIKENLTMGSDPNALPDMNIRGGTSFDDVVPGNDNLKGNYQNKPNQPLFILDGFETSVERIFDLDMNTVESLTILKDASAKALYGSKAANGVVIIESKKLNSSKPRISYTGSLDVTMPDLSSYNLVSALEKLDVEFREGLYPESEPASIQKYYGLRKQVLGGLNTYWLSKPVRMGYGQKHALNVDLGKDELRTNINLSHYDNVGVMLGSGRKILSGDINILYSIKKFRLQNRLNLVQNNASDSPYGSFDTYTRLNSYLNPYDQFGNMRIVLENGAQNPLNDGIIPTSLTSKYFEVTNNFEAEYQVVTGFKARARFGITRKNNNADRYYPATHSNFVSYKEEDAFRKGQYEANYGNRNNYSGDFYLNYNSTIKSKHNLFITSGVNFSENKFREEVNYAEGFPSAYMSDIMFAYQYNAKRMRPGGLSGFTRELGLLSMLSYTYMDRFLFDGTFRLNASSVFGNDNLLAPFWSLGLGWNLHKENFLKNVEGIRQLKIRGSLGSTGNQNFLTNKSLTVNKYYLEDRYATQIGSYAANMENPQLKWEEKMDYNVGIDADLYGLNIKLDIYKAITQNMVTSIASAPSTGFSNVSDNLGKVENKGFELALAYTLFQSKNGFFRVNAATTNNKNTILEISEAMRTFNQKQLAAMNERSGSSLPGTSTIPTIMYYDGLAMNTIWAVPSYGIDPATGIELLRGKDGQATYIWKASDMVPSGVSVPTWRGNIGFNGEYKGIGLSVICTYQAGGQFYNSTLLNKVENVDIASNFDRRVLTERWMNPGQIVQYKRNTGSTPYDMRNGLYVYNTSPWSQELTRPTQRFVQNQNEINISSVSLSYDFNRKWLIPLGLERLRAFAFMNDVAKFSTIGIERGTSYPFARTVSFKLAGTF